MLALIRCLQGERMEKDAGGVFRGLAALFTIGPGGGKRVKGLFFSFMKKMRSTLYTVSGVWYHKARQTNPLDIPRMA